jgi:hypothetical protein
MPRVTEYSPLTKREFQQWEAWREGWNAFLTGNDHNGRSLFRKNSMLDQEWKRGRLNAMAAGERAERI